MTPAIYLILTAVLTGAAFWMRPLVSAAALAQHPRRHPFLLSLEDRNRLNWANELTVRR